MKGKKEIEKRKEDMRLDMRDIKDLMLG